MPATNPQYLAYKCLERNTVIAQEAIAKCLAVNMNGNIVTTPGSYVYGFAFFDAETSQPLTVETKGECIAIAGAAFAKQAELANNASGKLVTATTGQQIVARAMETVTTANTYTIVQKTEEGKKAA